MKDKYCLLHIVYAIIFCLVGVSANAETIGDLNYSFWDNTCTLTGTDKIVSSVIIPDSISYNDRWYKVTAIQYNAFDGNSSLTSIVIPKTVTNINFWAFHECHNLTSVTFEEGSTLPNIGWGTFISCSSLASIIIPKSVTSIDRMAFQDCSKLTSVTFEDGSALAGICEDAFRRCSSLTSITIPKTVTSIGKTAFENCNNLTSVTFEEGSALAGIETESFNGCSSLASIVIPKSLTCIGGSAFGGCSSLSSVTFEDGISLTTIGDNAFNGCTSLVSIVIPKSVTSIVNSAFNGCNKLSSITYQEGNALTSIGDNAFNGCSSLTSVIIPKTVTSIVNGAFYGCHNLTSVTFEDISALDSIGENAFYGCDNAGVITLPKSVAKIGKDAFNGVPTVRLSSSIPASITANICGTIMVPETAISAYQTAKVWSTLTNVCIDKKYEVTLDAAESTSSLLAAIGENTLGNVLDLKINGTINGYDIMVIRNKMSNLRYLDLSDCSIKSNPYQYYTGYNTRNDTVTGYSFYKTQLYSVILPKNIKSIGCNAFAGDYSNRSNLHQVTGMSSSCKSIESNAFSYSAIKDIVLGDSVTTIGSNAFAGCDNLKSISLPNTLESIGFAAFSPCSSLTNISLPSSLNTIDGCAFNGCGNLISISIPGSVKSIGDNAFAGCGNLKTIYASTIQPISINQNTFSNYSTATLYVPKSSYYLYYWNTQWSQFSNVKEFDPTIENAYVNDGSDYSLNDKTGTISGDPNIDMNSNSGLIIDGGSTQNTGDLNVGQTSSVIADNNLKAKNLNIKIDINGNQWYFFCFPYDIPLTDIKFKGHYVLRYYDGDARAKNGNGGWKDITGSSIIAGNGYIFQGEKNGTLEIPIKDVTFKKEDKDKNLEAHTSANKQDASWNFVGNPYTSFYDIVDMNLSAPITVWNGSSYEALSPTDDDYQLTPFQAFFIQKPTDANAVGFSGDCRETKVQIDAKKASKAAKRAARRAAAGIDRKVINITITGNSGEDHTRVVFNDQKSADYDIACDAAKFMSTTAAAQIYSLDSKAVKYAINERPVSNGIVNLGYQAGAAAEYEIAAPRMDAPVYLKDNLTGVVADLSDGAYHFTSEQGTFDNRFSLLSENAATAISSTWKDTGISVAGERGGINISGAGSTVDVYSIDGKAEAKCGNGFVNMPAGTYIVKCGNASTRVIVK